ncbi:MAG: hydantoinase B/oxoprolinase family protein, partial [Planctomycetales bacterium]|nr:hydantoinase B/oxoprolinase family protein [Planctomycetales bacterium]
MTSERWQFWIDVGGTFTDCIARRPDGQLVTTKVLSTGVTKGAAADGSATTAIVDLARCGDPPQFWDGYELRLIDTAGNVVARSRVASFHAATGALRLTTPLSSAPTVGQTYELAGDEEAPVLAIRWLLGLRRDEPIPSVVVRLGTTRGTNALITRRGARTALVTTRGFADVLHIGYQNRPRIFELAIAKPPPLFAAVAEIDERVTADGAVLRAPDKAQVREALAALRGAGVESLAVCLLHAYRYPKHEQFVAAVARELGFDEISTSSSVAPLVKIVSRGDTTVLDAYLNPVLRGYVARLRRSLGDADLRILTSAGGLVAADEFVGKDSILSGPAGGVVGFSAVARAAGFDRAIGFDMGGTSTDVARFDGRYELEYETQKAGVRVVAPMMSIETVAAGGGSICRFDGVKLTVGPESAGADPGPACYGGGGPLAVTDLNLVLGKVLPERFPFPLDRAAALSRLTEIAAEVHTATGKRYEPIELADGFLRVANANMVAAIRSISIAKGSDPRDYVMVAFGGAAAQHACAVARELGIRQVLNHKSAGVLSALGIGMANVTRHLAVGVYVPYNESAVAALEARFAELEADGRRQVQAEGVAPQRISVTRSLDLRYRGLDAYLTIPQPERGSYDADYAKQHQALYGYVHEGRALEIVAARIEVTGTASDPLPTSRQVDVRETSTQGSAAQRTTEAWFDGQRHGAAVWERAQLQPGERIAGPAIICEDVSTTVIDPGWSADVLSGGELLLHDTGRCEAVDVSAQADPVMLEIFNNQFAGIAEQMGITLRNTSSSVNVKERLDFSCALFTPDGDLVVNAPHIPVHLGAMSETVRATIRDNPSMRPGDVYVTNDPYRGGSHLPDVTVVTPLFDGASGRLLFFTASRAHHAEIGGVVPGSMPPFSHNLADEGVLIRNFQLVDAGVSRYDALRAHLEAGPYPSRSVDDNLADVAAQV